MKSAFPILSQRLFLVFFLAMGCTFAQHVNILTAQLDDDTKEISIQQEFQFKNNSNTDLNVLYFNDWANAYASKSTGLAKRFEEEFKRSLHLAKDRQRGFTRVMSMVDDDYRGLVWERTSEEDIIKIRLNETLPPGEIAKIFLTYTVKLPENRFTPYGYDKNGNYYLKDWYMTPAFYDGVWHLYSNKNLEDLYTGITNTTLNFKYPAGMHLASNFRVLGNTSFPNGQMAQLSGSRQKSGEIILNTERRFTTHVTPEMTVITDLEASKYSELSQSISITRVTKFIEEHLGEYPHQQLLVSEIDYNKNPLYGINQLPSFIRPYEEQFQFEMKVLKTGLINILEESLYLDPRKDQWLSDAIANYIMIAYVDEYYPDQKLLGKLSRIWGVRSYNLAKMDFNAQYPFLYMLMARKNIDQPLTTPNDSLTKFNQKIANKYKAGLGLAYLASYIGKEKVDQSIKSFYQYYKLSRAKILDFESIIKRSTDKDIDWFFKAYVTTDWKIDFKIKEVEKMEDSLRVTLKNKSGVNVPISLFGMRNDSVVSKYWFPNITDEKTVTIPKNDEKRLVLNYDQKIPEFNQRDNWKSLGGFLSGNRKLKFTFFQDSENPYYNQIFYIPEFSFNVYDGWTPFLKLYNKTFLERPFTYSISPGYSFRENAFVGGGRVTYRKYLSKTGLYLANYSVGGSTSHFQVNSRFISITPSITFGWRPENLISNKKDFLTFRYVNILRDLDESLGEFETPPDYSVLNARFTSRNPGLINYFSWFVDAQHANDFSKMSVEMEYRKLFESNRQLNLRFFAGKFLRNKTLGFRDPNFFSFALDRPTDYLFDYGYLGRSEDSGIYSQQIIIAEGGFKSFLPEQFRFANDWIATVNASANLWRWIELYGDLGYVKNRGVSGKFVYDSGVRLNLVTDYFELYFPLYSNNGWEVSQPNYSERIRFIVTLDIKTLTGLFTRRWY